MKNNSNLAKAKREKNDEFYSMYSDIEKELQHYEKHFVGKVIYCNCDSSESNFVKYFKNNAERLRIKELHFSWYNQETGEGSFNSKESIELLKEADIVVTNPPFSLFREFIALLEEHNKQYLVIGNQNAITYKETFKLIKDNKLWLGMTQPKEFRQPDNSIKKFGNICWFTNLTHSKRNEPLLLCKTYAGNEAHYPKYDNYDSIEVSKTKDIPLDYEGVMGVPISWLDKYCVSQFEILGLDNNTLNEGLGKGCNSIKGESIYRRIIIKHKTK